MQSAISPGLIAARPLCVTFGRPTILGSRPGDPSRIAVWLSSRLGCGRREHAEWLHRHVLCCVVLVIIYGIMSILLSIFLLCVGPIILHRTGDRLGLNSHSRYRNREKSVIYHFSSVSLSISGSASDGVPDTLVQSVASAVRLTGPLKMLTACIRERIKSPMV